MAKDLWNDDEEEITGEYVREGSEGFPIIPKGTRVKACIDKAEWGVKENYGDGNEMQDCISMRFDIEEGEFKGQKIFKNFFMDSSDDEKNRAIRKMLMNVDLYAGGKIRALGRKPKDEELARHLINKSMIIAVGHMVDKKTKEERNFFAGVTSDKNTTTVKPVPKREATRKPAAYAEDDDIPFN